MEYVSFAYAIPTIKTKHTERERQREAESGRERREKSVCFSLPSAQQLSRADRIGECQQEKKSRVGKKSGRREQEAKVS